jgi:hypothetical protein
MNTPPSARGLPDVDRLSVMAAVILLSFALSRVFTLPVWRTEWQIWGTNFLLDLDLGNVVLIITGGLTAAGVDWLLHDHPGRGDLSTTPHWLLPSLAAVVVGLALDQLPFDSQWWLGLAVGGIVLIAVLTAEYITLDQHDARLPLASLVLVATAFTLYLILVVNLSLAGFRLYVLLPIIFIGSALVSLRVLHLRLNGEWAVYESLIVAWIVTQVAAALHYWPVSALRYGIWVLGVLYALSALFVNLIEERTDRSLYTEAALSLIVALIGGLFWG